MTWFGTGTVSTKNKKFRPFKEAREFVQTLLNLKGYQRMAESIVQVRQQTRRHSMLDPDKQYCKK